MAKLQKIAVVVFLFTCLYCMVTKAATPRAQWEYTQLTFTNEDESALNKLGAQGWELTASSAGAYEYNRVIYTFKRLK